MSVPTMTPLYTNTTPPDAIDNPYVGRALEHTVQGQRPPFGGGAIDLYSVYDRRDILPRRDGTKYRDRVLRLWWEHDYNTIWRSAVSGLIKWYCSIPYEIEANEPVANYFQDLLQYAQFGLGWKALWGRVWKDFFNQDAGGIIEIIATGDPNGPITENDVVVGLAHLDAQRCYLTGNHIYPIIYYSAINGTMHRMHHSRVYRFVDEPSPDERLYGIGDCAFGRGIAIAKRQILMGQYIEASLDDRPPPGINVFSNIDRAQFDKAMAVYNRDQQSDVRPEWGRQVNFFAVDPTQKAEITNLSFSQPPEKFDFISYMNQDVNLLALCLGVDKQELWELTGGGIGTGTQSSVLNQKSQGKAKADLLSMAERFLNIAILPESATFRSKYRDSQQDQQLAALDTQLTTTVTTAKAGGILSTDEGRNFLADRSESFQQVLTDESGKVTAYDDNRIQPVVPSTTTLTDTQNQPGQQQTTVPDLSIEAKAISWDEAKHPRADDGKFGSGSGGGKQPVSENKPSDNAGLDSETQNLINNLTPEQRVAVARRLGITLPDQPKVPSNKPTRNYQDYSNQSEAELARNYQPSVPKPTKSEKASLDYYRTSLGAYTLNKSLRTQGSEILTSQEKQYAKNLDSVIDRSTLDNDSMLYRGMQAGGSRVKQFGEDIKAGRIKPGSIIKDNGYSSTTLDGKIAQSKFAENGGVVFNIKAPKGSRGLCLNCAADKFGKRSNEDVMFSDEKEVLLPRGSQLKINGLKKSPKGGYIVDAELLPYEGSPALKSIWSLFVNRKADKEALDRNDRFAMEDYEIIETDESEQTHVSPEDTEVIEKLIKAYSSTAREFESWFEGQVLSVVRKEAFAPSQRQFAVLLQNELRKSGEQAFLDGKRYGGNREPLDQDDLFDINTWWLDQSSYVDSFASELFTQGLTELEADTRASMWANKSLKSAYDAGVVSTDRSGLYEWVIGPTEEHCDDCQRLNGQVHKRIEWFRRGWQPQSSKLKCSGFNCSCRLVKTTNAAVGRF